MATPNLDTIIMQFRRLHGDLYQPDGSVVTSAAQNGLKFSVAEATDLAVFAINELLQQAYRNVQSGSIERSSAEDMFGEYKDRTEIALTVTGIEGGGDLPAGYILAFDGVMKRTTTIYKRAKLVTWDEFNYILENIDLEQRYAPVFQIIGTKVYVLYIDVATPLVNTDTLVLHYMKSQPAVTQGGATDVLIRSMWFGQVVKIMNANADILTK